MEEFLNKKVYSLSRNVSQSLPLKANYVVNGGQRCRWNYKPSPVGSRVWLGDAQKEPDLFPQGTDFVFLPPEDGQ